MPSLQRVSYVFAHQSRTTDWVVTSGGIGPTPDDITYAALARAFNVPLEYDSETIRRMEFSAQYRRLPKPANDEIARARNRMALFPAGAQVRCGSQVIFPTREYWVPVVRIGGNICVLPGVPRVFEALLEAYTPFLGLDPSRARPIRRLIQCNIPESALAPLLERLTSAGERDGVRVGSYPRWGAGVHLSFIGSDATVLDRYVSDAMSATGGTPV